MKEKHNLVIVGIYTFGWMGHIFDGDYEEVMMYLVKDTHLTN